MPVGKGVCGRGLGGLAGSCFGYLFVVDQCVTCGLGYNFAMAAQIAQLEAFIYEVAGVAHEKIRNMTL